MWEMDYDAAAEHWINKDKESVHMDSAALEEKIEDFITNQPENPWSLDRGMNGVRFKANYFTEIIELW